MIHTGLTDHTSSSESKKKDLKTSENPFDESNRFLD